MSSLSETDKRYLENILDMGSGYVLDFSNAAFGDLFRRFGVDIHGDEYQTYGTSKANKMRSFWDREPDAIVAKVLSEMIDIYETNCILRKTAKDIELLERVRSVVARLSGEPDEVTPTDTDVAAVFSRESLPTV